LTLRKSRGVGGINTLELKIAIGRDDEHLIWYGGYDAVPYVAVNEAEHAASRRFGRDSFQTRSRH
jgi:hypothetical protein